MKAHIGMLVFLACFPGSILADFKEDVPALVCTYLDEVGLGTGKYRNDIANEYLACSPYKELGGGSPLRNNIAFYVHGTKDTVKLLKLVLNVNYQPEAAAAHEELAKTTNLLAKKALAELLPKEIKHAIQNGKTGEWSLAKAKIRLTRLNWPTGKGYELKLTIE